MLHYGHKDGGEVYRNGFNNKANECNVENVQLNGSCSIRHSNTIEMVHKAHVCVYRWCDICNVIYCPSNEIRWIFHIFARLLTHSCSLANAKSIQCFIRIFNFVREIAMHWWTMFAVVEIDRRHNVNFEMGMVESKFRWKRTYIFLSCAWDLHVIQFSRFQIKHALTMTPFKTNISYISE